MLGPYVDSAANLRVANVPVGKAFIYSLSYGLVSALLPLMSKLNVPSALTGPALAAILGNVAPVKRFLGDNFSEALAIVATMKGIDETFKVSAMTDEYFTKMLSGITGVVTPTITNPPVSGPSAPMIGQSNAFVSTVQRKLRSISI